MLLDSEPGVNGAPKALRRSGLWSALVLALVTLFWTEPASAYAWMIRHAYTGCGVCHADPAGGELLTMYGRMQGNLFLRMQYGGDSKPDAAPDDGESKSGDDLDFVDDFDFDTPPASGDEASDEAQDGGEEDGDDGEGDAEGDDTKGKPEDDEEDEAKSKKGKNADYGGGADEPSVGFLWGLLPTPPGVLLGGGFRNLAIYQLGAAEKPFKFIPVMMGDLYLQVRGDGVRVAATAGISKVPVGSPHARAAQVTLGQGDQFNMLSRTHWLGFDFGENDEHLLRFGRINLPFGVRIPEHTMWVREATRTDRESDQQHGVALSLSGEKYRAEVMGIIGNYQINPDRYRERGYSLFMEYFPGTSGLAVGVSSLITYAEVDRVLLREDVVRQAHGAMTRYAPAEWLTILAEADMLLTTGSSLGYTGFAQFDFEFVQGLHFMLTGELVDQGFAGKEGPTNPRIPGVGEMRWGAWASIDWFFYDQFEFRIDAMQRQEADMQILGQLHFYL